MQQMLKSITILVVFLITGIAIEAQGNEEIQEQPIYYIALDGNGLQQVFKYAHDSDHVQITTADTDVMTFGVAPDAQNISYISDGQLWLQMIGEEPEILTPLEAIQFSSSPVYSQDGNVIAYADNGLWLIDVVSGEKRQLLTDVPLAEMASNADEYRIYQPSTFIIDETGDARYLVVDVGIWEWKTSGIYDLSSDEFSLLEGQQHTELIVLEDGRVIIYGNNGVGGEAAVRVASNIASINNSEQLFLFSDVTDATVFAQQAIEIETDVVRIFGMAISEDSDASTDVYFYVDIDTLTGTHDDIQFIPVEREQSGSQAVLSPDGHQIAIYRNVNYSDAGYVTGDVELFGLESMLPLNITVTDTIGNIQWETNP